MIVYFANRQMQILGMAATSLPSGFVIVEDQKTEEIETGVATFSCRIGFDKDTRLKLEEMTNAGNYLLRSNGDENEFYTIIDTEIDTKAKEIYIYAEDAGLDLINEIAPAFEAPAAYSAKWYVEKYIKDSGFEIGINEFNAKNTKKLSWDGEETVTGRLASIAQQFGGYDVSYSFEIKGLEITHKYVNFYKKRGKDDGIQLRLNREVDRIITTKSVANLATALICEGGVPDDAEEPITLKGYKYDDGDLYVGDDGILRSRKAVRTWSRYVWNKEPNQLSGYAGHILRPYSYNTTDQAELCTRARTELRSICDMEINFEIDINRLPPNVKIGDRVTIIDDAGELYVSSRVLMLESSVTDDKYKATLGEHLIKKSGISKKVTELAEQFAKTAQSAARALSVSNTAKADAVAAAAQAETAKAGAEAAQGAALLAKQAADTAQNSAATAQSEAGKATAAVTEVQASVSGMQTTVNNAKTAADNALAAAATAESKADDARSEAEGARNAAENAAAQAAQAIQDATEAKSAADAASNEADSAIGLANEASTIAAAAKLDSEQAKKDVNEFAESLDRTVSTMKAEYARKTDLTETAADLESKIERSAGILSSTISMRTAIDETANDAASLAEKAAAKAEAAQQKAAEALLAADDAQRAANEAGMAAEDAQQAADNARAAADEAQAVLTEATAELDKAKADLATIKDRADATEEEIAAAEEAVATAQAAADTAKADAEAASAEAESAKAVAEKALKDASNAQANADAAAEFAKMAQSLANEAESAKEAQITADDAVSAASNAQGIAEDAAHEAQTAYDTAMTATNDAASAYQAASEATAKAQQAESDLNTAKKNLADTMSRVDATEEEIAAAEAAVLLAQQAADKAKADAAAAQAKADQAKADAENAQNAADEAQEKADQAKDAADTATAAANAAQQAVDALRIRVEVAETNITQTSQQIQLLATKAEVAAISVGGRNLLSDTDFGGVSMRYERLDGMGSEGGFRFTPTVQIESGVQYTLHARIRGTANLNFYQLNTWIPDEETGETPSGSANYSVRFIDRAKLSENEYRHFSIIFTVAEDRSFKTAYICTAWGEENSSVGDWFEIEPKSLKLEKGNKFTDWTPAPEDAAKAVEAAQSAADKAQAAADNLADRVTHTEASITEHAGEIEMRATKEAVEVIDTKASNAVTMAEQANSDVAGLAYRVSNSETAIKSNYEQILLRATSTEVEGKIDNIKIGGENLLRDTDFGNTSKRYERHEGYSTEGGFNFGENGLLESGKEYTLSARIRGYANINMWEMNDYNDNVYPWISRANLSITEYRHFEITFTMSEYYFTSIYIATRYGEDCTAVGDWFEIEPKSLKLEEGNKATAWRPAQHDISEDIGEAQATATEAVERITTAESLIQQLADSISMLVRGENGGTLLKQDANGFYYFDVSELLKDVSENSDGLSEIEGLVKDANGNIDVLKSTAEALRKKTEYIRQGVDKNDQPYLELGEGDSTFKVKITNREIQFSEGTETPAKINRKMLVIQKAMMKNELQFGDDEEEGITGVWLWKRRSNGNLGLMWKGVSG